MSYVDPLTQLEEILELKVQIAQLSTQNTSLREDLHKARVDNGNLEVELDVQRKQELLLRRYIELGEDARRPLSDFVLELAEEDCAYGDNCPSNAGTRHGTCLRCRAEEALREARIISGPRETTND